MCRMRHKKIITFTMGIFLFAIMRVGFFFLHFIFYMCLYAYVCVFCKLVNTFECKKKFLVVN